MKIFEENKQVKKSWSIKLNQTDQKDSILKAVDSQTGEWICNLIVFSSTGNIYSLVNAKEELRRHGYNPHEHKNSFDTYGRLIIT